MKFHHVQFHHVLKWLGFSILAFVGIVALMIFWFFVSIIIAVTKITVTLIVVALLVGAVLTLLYEVFMK